MTTLTVHPDRDAIGHDPALLRYWLPILGPTAYVLHDHLWRATGCGRRSAVLHRDDIDATLGVKPHVTTTALARLAHFGLAEDRREHGYRLACRIPPLRPQQLRRLPDGMRGEAEAAMAHDERRAA